MPIINPAYDLDDPLDAYSLVRDILVSTPFGLTVEQVNNFLKYPNPGLLERYKLSDYRPWVLIARGKAEIILRAINDDLEAKTERLLSDRPWNPWDDGGGAA